MSEINDRFAAIGLGGWLLPADVDFIAKQVSQLEAGQTYLELGVAYGKSLITACSFAKEGVKIYGIDRLNWGERDENFIKMNVPFDRAKFIEGDSQEEAKKWDKPIDLLFIDCDHTYYGILRDLVSWLPHVQHEGKIMLHDYTPAEGGVMRAVHELIYPHKAYRNFTVEGSIYCFEKV